MEPIRSDQPGIGRIDALSSPTRRPYDAVRVDAPHRGRPPQRLDLRGGQPGAERGPAARSLRVITGELALVTPDAVVFRMKGRPGERVVFTFWVRP